MPVKILPRCDALVSISETYQKVENIFFGNMQISRLPDGSILPIGQSSPLVTLQHNTEKSLFFDFFKEACNRAESIGPGSSKFLNAFSKKVFLSLKDSGTEGKNSIKKDINSLIESLCEYSVTLTDSNVKQLLSGVIDDTTLVDIVYEAIQLAGNQSKIFIEDSVSMTTTIEKVEGYTFNIFPDAAFYTNGRWREKNVKCVIVDGIIDVISEIDTMLSEASDSKTAVAIFARGFSDDVINTLRTNKARGTLDVIPVCVPFDLQNANVLNDIAAVCSADVISSLKGEMLSTVSLDNLSVVGSVVCSNGCVTLSNACSNKGVKRQIASLKKKRLEQNVHDVKVILDKRIKSLSSSSVIIRIGKASHIKTIDLKEKLDIALKVIHSSLVHGFIDSSILKESIKNTDYSEYFEGILTTDWLLPTVSVASAIKFGTTLAYTLDDVGLVLLDDSL